MHKNLYLIDVTAIKGDLETHFGPAIPAPVFTAEERQRQRQPHPSIEDLLRHAFSRARHVALMGASDDEHLACACGAVVSYLIDAERDADRERLQTELDALQSLVAMAQAAQAGLTVLSAPEPPANPIGVLGLWRARHDETA